ncbi:ABC transporter permease [Salinibacter ruber]|uniref:ABC transporter permease n=1 Tax=Salinibacter ruber TaxID=146919 RepID=UPI000E57BBC0|nr:proline/glycine betaine ABC transporter permease [Salinibacter ruber]MCS3650400.1 glycine betaine/proline transport system permease protein [Salinibacter ruber]MCS3653652.1 glycine betaine/proline transport system permease protein [Salinibacter ruber]MCS4134125.1 glycine betaine/proline transport system permease protein [Salinibacter ruber]
MQLDLGGAFASLINWIQNNFGPLLDGIELVIGATIQGAKDVLLFLPSWAMIVLFTVLAWWVASRGVALFTVVGLTLLEDVEFALFGMEIAFGMGLWEFAMQTLALIATATLISLLVGIPVGIWAAKNDVVDAIVRPVLDFMQTMPAFVYLIPAVVLFGLGAVPGVIATFIFATPPCVRLTNLGIRQVSEEAVEAAESFGSTPSQMLFKVELPMALPTILAGVNQTVLLALSMVVIAALIGAGGLGDPVVEGIQQLRIGVGFEGGLAIVILAIFLDRITQAVGEKAGASTQPMTG